MSRLKLRKVQHDLLDTIKEEGARVLGIRTGSKHFLVDYTFDNVKFFVAPMPNGTSISPRWKNNFRKQLKHNRG